MFVRQLNRFLEVNDINIDRLQLETPVTRERRPNANDARIKTLIKRLETGRPSPITSIGFVKAVADMQSSKFKPREDIDSDSDSEVDNAEEISNDEEPSSDPDVAPPDVPEEESNDNLLCKICLVSNINAVLLPCTHTSCVTCGDRLQREKKHCHMCRGKIRRVMPIHIN